MHWIVVKLRAHGTHPVSHDTDMILKTYFDEAPGEHSDRNTDGDQYTVDAEHAVTIRNPRANNCWHRITEAEFNTGTYHFYVWAEPYATAAFAHGSDVAVGRVKLERRHETYRGPASGAGMTLYAGVDPEDELIVYDLKIANSVIQYIVDEMNTNRTSGFVMRHLDMRDDAAFLRWLQWPWATGDAFRSFLTTYGPWDHKPKIGPHWGELNRLGNATEYYFYDFWSNIHYGFIMRMAGYSEDGMLWGSNAMQWIDHAEGDSQFDQEPMKAGWRLAQAMGGNPNGRDVTRTDILTILQNHTHWNHPVRMSQGATAAPARPSTLQQFQDEMNRFDNMSPIDQANMLRRMLGG
ncbi:polymorphic toxin type 44 domain-containing protein [Yoonia sp. R2331]|uniref:polymorphic toxin type 44 domain-containing protein n=1 Tax=Yoonia sp. R2331 TaxID=3237238 RepID=UPI0034E40D5C